MEKKKLERKKSGGERKVIYNSHVHTFTFKNTPLLFPLLFFPDSITGNISIKRALVIAIVFSSLILTGALALLILSVIWDQLNLLWRTPYSEIQKTLITYFTTPPTTTIILKTPYRNWITMPILVIKDSLTLLFVFIVLQRIWNFIKGATTSLVGIARSSDRTRQLSTNLATLRRNINRSSKPLRNNPIFIFLGRLNPAPNDTLERYARFLNTALLGSQQNVFKEIRYQYPDDTKFVVLPMNMEHLGWLLGWVPRKIDNQHAELLRLARKVNDGKSESKKIVFPFFTVHPNQKNINKVIEKIERGRYFSPDKFRGLKIYPNLGYFPYDDNLMRIYAVCEENGIPVISHCTPHGIWKLGLSEEKRRDFGKPENYRIVLDKFKNLKICLAHFGGAEEWVNRLQKPEDETAWARLIYDMLRNKNYKNLYTDISYTIFEPKVKGLTIDLIDYLKVMLESNTKVREHVLFGSDYYMIEQEKITEKEVSILLRSRLGDDLFFQIAYTNPRRFLGIS